MPIGQAVINSFNAASYYVTPENVISAANTIYHYSMFAAEIYSVASRYLGKGNQLKENDTLKELSKPPTQESTDVDTIRRLQEELDRLKLESEQASTACEPAPSGNRSGRKGSSGNIEGGSLKQIKEVEQVSTKKKRRSLASEDAMIVESQERLGGARLTRKPTIEQVAAAKLKIQYDVKKCHFVVCGGREVGKSSFINAVRGISKRHEATAATSTGIKGMTRHPDPRSGSPFNRFVWYELGRPSKPNLSDSWEYFIDQGLFVFDFVVILYDTSFTEADARMLENCLRLNIPAFVVRSKADQHMRRRMKKDEGKSEDKRYRQAKYVEKVRAEFRKSLEQFVGKKKEEGEKVDQEFLKQKVYIVSKDVLAKFGTDALDGKRKLAKDKVEEIIDEEVLFGDMLDTAVKRRAGKQVEEKRKKFLGLV